MTTIKTIASTALTCLVIFLLIRHFFPKVEERTVKVEVRYRSDSLLIVQQAKTIDSLIAAQSIVVKVKKDNKRIRDNFAQAIKTYEDIIQSMKDSAAKEVKVPVAKLDTTIEVTEMVPMGFDSLGHPDTNLVTVTYTDTLQLEYHGLPDGTFRDIHLGIQNRRATYVYPESTITNTDTIVEKEVDWLITGGIAVGVAILTAVAIKNSP